MLVSVLSACSFGNTEAIESKKDVAVRLTLDEDNVLNIWTPDNSNLILSISFHKTDVIKIAKMIRGE